MQPCVNGVMLRYHICVAIAGLNPCCHAGHDEKSATEAWQRFTELSLLAFARHYFKAVASIVEPVEQDIFGEGASLKDTTVKALNECLHI